MDENREWISMSDLMSGLMLIFLFIVVSFMMKVDAEQQEIENIAETYEEVKGNLKEDLQKELEKDLDKWGAEILPDTTIRFKDTLLLFEPGSSKLKKSFKKVLYEFFPRFVKVAESYHDDIDEIRIEGHTSSGWTGASSLNSRYLNNADLSQKRSFAVLTSCFRLKSINKSKIWLTKVFRANGVAFASPILGKNGRESASKSRRVEFKIVLKTEEKIHAILEKLQAMKTKQEKNKKKQEINEKKQEKNEKT